MAPLRTWSQILHGGGLAVPELYGIQGWGSAEPTHTAGPHCRRGRRVLGTRVRVLEDMPMFQAPPRQRALGGGPGLGPAHGGLRRQESAVALGPGLRGTGWSPPVRPWLLCHREAAVLRITGAGWAFLLGERSQAEFCGCPLPVMHVSLEFAGAPGPAGPPGKAGPPGPKGNMIKSEDPWGDCP